MKKDRYQNTVQKSHSAKPVIPVYSPPMILSVEPLEAAAATCDGTGGYGKSVPTCNPRTLGS